VTATSADAAPIVVVGRIQGPYGIKGWVHVASFTDPRENIEDYSPWRLGSAGGSPGWQRVEVEQLRPHKQGYVAKLAGIEDRSSAELLKGKLIGVPESSLPLPAPDEYYWRELIGCQLKNADGTLLGRVRELIETGVHDVLVVESDDAEADLNRELLIPFHAAYVLKVDREAGEILVDWPLPEDD
jgi:16S rRNA processing protein RimM